MNPMKETIQKQQAYEFRKMAGYPANHSMVELYFPLFEQKIFFMQKAKKKQKRKQILKIIIAILLSILFILLEGTSMVAVFSPN